jgi:hypothetical protein
MRHDKTRDMIRSILPSTSDAYARFAKASRKRAHRHAIRIEVRCEDHEETAANLLRDCYVADIVRDRRGADKLHHFMRWCYAITEGMSTEDALGYVRAILPASLIGDHAYGHWEQDRKHDSQRRIPWHEQERRGAQSWRDSTLFHFRRALHADPELHARLNAEIKRRKAPGEPRRLLAGLHDVEAFVDAVRPPGRWETDLYYIERDAMLGGLTAALRVSGRAQVANDAVADVVDPTVDGDRLSARPGVAHDGRLGDIDHLLDDVQFAQAIVPEDFRLERLDLRLVFRANVLYVAEPIVDQAELLVA